MLEFLHHFPHESRLDVFTGALDVEDLISLAVEDGLESDLQAKLGLATPGKAYDLSDLVGVQATLEQIVQARSVKSVNSEIILWFAYLG